MAGEVMELIFAVLDVSFNRGYYTVIKRRQFSYTNFIKQWNPRVCPGNNAHSPALTITDDGVE